METVDQTLRLPSDLNAKVVSEASQERRTKHSHIIWILEEHFRKNGESKIPEISKNQEMPKAA